MRIFNLFICFIFIFNILAAQQSYHEKKSNISSISEQEETPLLINGVAVPSDFPVFEPTIIDTTSPGKLFVTNWTGTPYILILENDGTPYFYQKVEATSIDWKVQSTGLLTRQVRQGDYSYISMDHNYNILDTFKCQGYDTDEHDVVLLENGNSILIAAERKTVDMSQYVDGGEIAANVLGNHVQEIDSNNNVVFEFNCWDNFDITGAENLDLTAASIDYVHMNSIALDFDNNLLISSRNLSECTKVDRSTGQIMWRLGGKYNQFQFIDEEVMIDYQHDFRPVPGVPHHYTIYDNGNNRGYTRVVEYEIDTVDMTAKKVWEYRPTPDKRTMSMGSAQRLPNGNTLINWASAQYPKATEITPEGEIVYEANFATNTAGYRTFRFEWDGFLKEPYLIVEPLAEKTRLIFNKFGDTTVVEYRIYGGLSEGAEELITSTNKTWIDLEDLENKQTYFFKVTAVDKDGKESGYSNRESIFVRYPVPGDNVVQNGDFSDSTNNWGFYLFGGVADVTVNEDGQASFDITNGGNMVVSVQFRQNGVLLINGYTYVFEFDAVADVARTIVAKVGQDASPYTNYSKIGQTSITNEMSHYSYQFTMNDPTDLNSRVVFNVGSNNENVRIDNVKISIKEEEIPNNIDLNISHDFDISVFPNPVETKLSLKTIFSEPGNVKIILTDIAGRKVLISDKIWVSPGSDLITVDVEQLIPGIFFGTLLYSPNRSNNLYIRNFKVVKDVDIH